MPSKSIITPILPDHYYHIYNRGNNKEKIFFSKRNYSFFLNKYKEYMGNEATTYAYCLLPNHFHLLIKPKSALCSKQFRKFFQCYTLSINKQEKRSGSLFLKPFRRIDVDNMDYLLNLMFYIHVNPVKHGLSFNFRNFNYSSYSYYLNGMNTRLKDEVFSWYSGKDGFIDYHNYLHQETLIKKYIIED